MTIAKSKLEEQILSLIEGELTSQGFRVVDLDCHLAHHSVLRIFIERVENGVPSGKASLDDCANVSRLLNPILDAHEQLIEGRYDLEVSSPGLDRRLRTFDDFQRVLGQEVKLRLNERIEGVGANPRGQVKRVSGDALLLEVEGSSVSVPISGIRRANLVWKMEETGKAEKADERKGTET